MNPFNTDTQALMQEIMERHQQMTTGLQNLYQISEVNIGCTDHDIIYRQDKLSLRYYPSLTKTPVVLKSPLLIVYALVNRPEILDLQPDRSLIRALNELGIPVYLLDWGYPDAADCFTDLDDYINGYLDDCVDATCVHFNHQHKRNTEQVNLLGVCQGGTFSLCYTALHPEKVTSLITMVTPVDFHTPGNRLGNLLSGVDLDCLKAAPANLPGEMLYSAFQSLTPIKQGLQKSMALPNTLANKDRALNFLCMEKWLQHSPDLCYQAFVEFTEDFYQANGLTIGRLEIAGQTVDLKNITQPLLNLYARHDHLVPPASSKALKKLVASEDYSEGRYDCGHIGIFVGSKAIKRLPKQLVDWLQKTNG